MSTYLASVIVQMKRARLKSISQLGFQKIVYLSVIDEQFLLFF